MKTYTTTQGQEFTIDYASSITAGHGHQKITAYVMAENGDKKEFSAKTSNMPDFDEATDLEGQEKYEALFDLVDYSLDGEISEWIYELSKIKTYKVNLNKKDNGSTELKSFTDLNKAFDFFTNLDISELEETNNERDEYELAPYIGEEIQEWSIEELKKIDWPLNQWVVKN